jgi:HrpA-like RNA helicase
MFPVEAYQKIILDTVEKNPITIICAEPAAGKSTIIPPYLWSAGYNVVVTEPGRVIARQLAKRVSENLGSALGKEIGYQTAFEKCYSESSEILYRTDGLQVIHEITGNVAQNGRRALVIDEAHTMSENVELLLALAKDKYGLGGNTKVVIMSATLDYLSLSKYYGNAAVVNIPGRMFPIEDRPSSGDLIQDISSLVMEGCSVQVFVAGKREIDDTISKLRQRRLNAVLLPLHAELDASEQQKCFDEYDSAKVVVCTNLAQSGLTIPGIRGIVDTGVENRIELENGIESLVTRPISKADAKQRRGRAGRTQDGIYIYCSTTPYEKLQEYPTPEIKRRDLSQTVLRFASNGIDAEKYDFYHQPDKKMIRQAKKSLVALGAMNKDGTVTDIGHEMAQLPISVKYARMLVAAKEYNVLDEMITIAAILEAGGIRHYKDEYYHYTSERSSDPLAELDLFNLMRSRKARLMPGVYDEHLYDGINKNAYRLAFDLQQKLYETMRSKVGFITSCHDRENIKKACIAGLIEHVYNRYGRNFKCGNDEERQIDRGSVLNHCQRDPDFIVGLPKNLPIRDKMGSPMTLYLVSMCSIVTAEQLKEVAPQLFEESFESGSLSDHRTYVNKICTFNGEIVSERQCMPENLDEICEFLGVKPEDLQTDIDEVVAFSPEDGAYNLKRYFYEGNVVFIERLPIEDREKAANMFATHLALETLNHSPSYSFYAPSIDTYAGMLHRNQHVASSKGKSRETLLKFYQNRLAGARCINEVKSFVSLVLNT